MRLAVEHRTRFGYAGTARESHNEVRMLPTTDEGQTLIAFDLETTPAARVFRYEVAGGTVHHFDVLAPHEALEIVTRFEVETHRPDLLAPLAPEDDLLAAYADPELALDHVEWLDGPELADDVAAALAGLDAQAAAAAPPGSASGYLLALGRVLHEGFAFDPSATTVTTSLAEVLERRRGVCQDIAGVMLAICRRRGIPSRYVSGYLHPVDRDVVGGEAGHAWVECLLPGGAWLGLDPTNGIAAGDGHVRVFTGRGYADAAPTRGVYLGAPTTQLEVSVDVRSLAADR